MNATLVSVRVPTFKFSLEVKILLLSAYFTGKTKD